MRTARQRREEERLILEQSRDIDVPLEEQLPCPSRAGRGPRCPVPAAPGEKEKREE